eukprot:scaffold65615_cov16-Tisochrysis_lutea.AAC.1
MEARRPAHTTERISFINAVTGFGANDIEEKDTVQECSSFTALVCWKRVLFQRMAIGSYALEMYPQAPIIVLRSFKLRALKLGQLLPLKLYAFFKLHALKLGQFLQTIEAGYSPLNPYHNAVHATDVLQ